MNLGLLGALGGLGQGMQVAGLDMIKQDNEVARDERSLIMQKNLLQTRDDMDAAKARRISGEVNAEAGRIASTRATGLLGSARQAYADGGVPADQAEALLSPAVAEYSVPTNDDRIQAGANLGYISDLAIGERNDKKLDREENREDRKLQNTRLDDDRKENRAYQRDSLAETKRYHDILDGTRHDAIAARSTAAGAGRDPTLARDRYDAKEWHTASKELEKYTAQTTDDGMGGKPVTKTNLTALNFSQTQMAAARNAGINPYDAVTSIGAALAGIKEKADARVRADPKLSPDVAYASEMKLFKEIMSRPAGSSADDTPPAKTKDGEEPPAQVPAAKPAAPATGVLNAAPPKTMAEWQQQQADDTARQAAQTAERKAKIAQDAIDQKNRDDEAMVAHRANVQRMKSAAVARNNS